MRAEEKSPVNTGARSDSYLVAEWNPVDVVAPLYLFPPLLFSSPRLDFLPLRLAGTEIDDRQRQRHHGHGSARLFPGSGPCRLGFLHETHDKYFFYLFFLFLCFFFSVLSSFGRQMLFHVLV